MSYSTVSGPSNPLKRIGRLQHVINTFVKHGFDEVMTRLRVWEAGAIEERIFHRHPQLPPELSVGERLRLALEELGPTFIKLGQTLSTRPDLVPADIINELKKLQFSVHFIPVEIIRHIVETELRKPIDQIFDSFDDTPLAAASLAQVHRAVYRGRQVVLKVQRPHVEETIGQDVDIMRNLVGLVERYFPSTYLINPSGMVEEFTRDIKKELDFFLEAHNMVRFAQNFADDDTIHVPEVYLDLCTPRLVTMEYLDGIHIWETQRLIDEGYDTQLIARRGALVGIKAIFEHGFFHADPHPGNIFVLPGNVIGLVDYGMMASLSTRDRERTAKLMNFISARDDKRVARALNELMESEDVVPAEELEPAMTSIIQEYTDLPVCELRFAGMLFAMMRAVMEQGGRLRPQLIWITKSIATQEEMACSLKADFNLMEIGRPYAKKVLSQKLNPFRRPQELYYWLIDALDTIKDIPYDAGIIMREIRKGRIKIEFEHVGLEPIRHTMETMANRQSLTNIIVALLISSSVVVLAKIPPFVAGIPLLGFVGYIIALVLGLILTYSVTFGRRR
jgi:ubiquinone biosynthesis protein